MRTEKDTDFLAKESNFAARCNQFKANFAVELSEADELAADVAELKQALSDVLMAKAALKAARARKNDLRRRIEERTSAMRRSLRASRTVTEVDLAAFGLKPADRIRTPVGAPDEPPDGTVAKMERLTHIIAFWSSGAVRRRGKPKGVIGAEVWLRIGEGSLEADDFRLVELATASPHRVQYRSADAGKMAYYKLRWVTRRGEKSSFSSTFAATIPG